MSESLNNKCFLVVEDDSFSRAILLRHLKRLQVKRVREAHDGLQALEALGTTDHFDAVILDFQMPGRNGIEVLKAIRTASTCRPNNLPVAMLTGYADASLVQMAMALDVSAFLVKPVSEEVLRQRLRRILAEDRARLDPAAYRAVELPWEPKRDLATEVLLAAPEFNPASKRPEMRIALSDVPLDAVLARDVMAQNGAMILPAGTVMTGKVIARLEDLRGLDPTLDQIWILPPQAA